MKIAIISDIHGNLEALQEILKDIKYKKVNKIFCLGDIIGYGPCPRECLQVIKKNAEIILRGNHEDAAINFQTQKRMSNYALAGINYSLRQLKPDDLIFFKSLPLTKIIHKISISLTHASFVKPAEWSYIKYPEEIKKELQHTQTQFCFVGHTHIPFIFGSKLGLRTTLPDKLILDKSQKFFINVGSVGQPRNGDYRACYGILEINNNQITFNQRRIFYNINKTSSLIRSTKLPSFLSERLFRGK